MQGQRGVEEGDDKIQEWNRGTASARQRPEPLGCKGRGEGGGGGEARGRGGGSQIELRSRGGRGCRASARWRDVLHGTGKGMDAKRKAGGWGALPGRGSDNDTTQTTFTSKVGEGVQWVRARMAHTKRAAKRGSMWVTARDKRPCSTTERWR